MRYIALMKRLTILAVVVALAACGGKSKPATTTTEPVPTEPGNGRMAAPGTVLGDTAVWEHLKASSLSLPLGHDGMECAGDAANLGVLVGDWATQMGGVINASCESAHCTVIITSKVDPSCDTNRDEGCDASSMTIQYDLDDAGAIESSTVMCMGAG